MKPQIILREPRIFTNHRQPIFDCVFIGAAGPESEPGLRVYENEVELKVSTEQIAPFAISLKKKPGPQARYYRLIPEKPLSTGQHKFSIRWEDPSGDLIVQRVVRLTIDLAPPRVLFLSPAEHSTISPGAGAELLVSDRRVCDALLRSTRDLSSVGAAFSEYLSHLGVFSIEDLLWFDPAAVYSPNFTRGELLNFVTRARLIDRFSFHQKNSRPC